MNYPYQISNTLWKVSRVVLDYADLLQHCYESWYLEDGIVKDGDYSMDAGFGLRAIHGGIEFCSCRSNCDGLFRKPVSKPELLLKRGSHVLCRLPPQYRV